MDDALTAPADAPGGLNGDHGGDLTAAAARQGIPAEDWLDLSTGINPEPYPVGELGPDAWGRLPQADADAALRRAVADYLGLSDMEMVLPVPGSQAAIQMLPSMVNVNAVRILGPTYGEFETVFRAHGSVVEVWDHDAEAGLPPPGAPLIVVNPNNPDGRVIPPSDLLIWARAAETAGHVLVVDEAFGDLDPGASVAPEIEALPNVMVLRSFGKFFGLAGVRLGFLLGSNERIRAARARLGPWAVSGPALSIGQAAYADRAWISATREHLARQRVRLERLLQDHGLTPVGGTDLYVLARHGNAEWVARHLEARAILVRRFAGRPGLLRFGLAGPETHWRRLEAALAQIPH